MEWRIWVTWWIIFCIRYSRLFWIYLKKHEKVADYPSIKIYVNKIENRITFKIKTEYYPEFSTSETMKLLESTKSKINEDKEGESVPHLEINEVAVIRFNIVNNDYQQDSRVLYTFVPKKSFCQLLDISPKYFIFLKTFDSDFSCFKLWFSDQSSKPLEIEDEINVTLITN